MQIEARKVPAFKAGKALRSPSSISELPGGIDRISGIGSRHLNKGLFTRVRGRSILPRYIVGVLRSWAARDPNVSDYCCLARREVSTFRVNLLSDRACATAAVRSLPPWPATKCSTR